MGYTHYWESGPISPDTLAALATDVRNIVLASELPIAGWDGTGEPEYGPDRISLNGIGDDAHESFVIEPSGEWTFCKTAYKPYDVVVTAALLALRDRTGARLSSDGDTPDWIAGHALAERATGRTIAPFTADED